ncbi:MAG: LysR family nitrogen assimilation transcriptional regulator [Cocleimonas sp.]|jgi:LysR family nitrogen assimilation transcriptional regulator
MNTKQLEYFLTTSEQGSIAGAARVLNVAQPAISLQLSNLEHKLKVSLFERNYRGVKLTDAGSKFVKHAHIILLNIREAKAELAQKYSGKVVVGLSQSICNVLSIELLTQLECRFANVELIFRIGPSYIVDSWFLDNQVDIILCTDHSGQINDISTRKALIREDLFLHIADSTQNPIFKKLASYSSISFADLQHYEIFMPDKEDALSKLLMKQAQDLGIELKTNNAFGRLTTTLNFVAQGLGLVVSPSSSIFHLGPNKELRAINIIQPNLHRDIYLKVTEQKRKNKAVEAVFDLIREVTATVHSKGYWKGTLLDNKYSRSLSNNTEILSEI